MDNNKPESAQADEQLHAIFHDTAIWVLYGTPGVSLGQAASLEAALEKYVKLAQSGATVSAWSRLPMNNLVILAPQIDRLTLLGGWPFPHDLGTISGVRSPI